MHARTDQHTTRTHAHIPGFNPSDKDPLDLMACLSSPLQSLDVSQTQSDSGFVGLAFYSDATEQNSIVGMALH